MLHKITNVENGKVKLSISLLVGILGYPWKGEGLQPDSEGNYSVKFTFSEVGDGDRGKGMVNFVYEDCDGKEHPIPFVSAKSKSK